MKKQSLSALLLATALLATGFVSSCKDNDSDLFTELDRELTDQATLSQALQAQIDELQSKISVLEAKKECTCQMTDEWKKVLSTGSFDQAFSDTWYAYYSNLYATSEAVKAAADKAQEALTYAENLAAQVEKNAADIVTLDGKITTLNTLLETAQKTADEAKQLAGDALSKADAAQITADSALALAKQNQSDLADLSSNLTTLTNRVNVISDRLQVVADSAALAYGKAVELDGKYSALRFTVDSLGNVVTAYGDTLNVMGVRVDSLNTVVTTYSYRIDSLGNVVDQFDNRISTVEYKVDSLGNITTSLDSKINSAISTLRNEAATNLQLAYNYATNAVNGMANTLRGEMDDKIKDLRNELKPLIDANAARIEALADTVRDNKLRIDTLYTTVDSLAKELATLSDEVNNLKTDFSNLITGIIIQGTHDPVFGYLALPLGIQTNILAAYYGDALETNLTFPTTRNSRYVNPDLHLTDEEVAAIGTLNTTTLSAGTALIADTVGTGNAGKIYLTINPSNIDFTGKKLSLVLVNSRGEESKIKLTNIKHSDALLTFGYTRGGDAFYEADAVLEAADAPTASPNINLSSFKTVAKDLLNNHTFDATTFVTTLYQNVSGILPRYAVETYWTNSSNEKVAIVSGYDLAATALKPLSYNFSFSTSVDPSLPLIDQDAFTKVIDQMTGDISIDIKFDKVEFTAPQLNIKIDWSDLKFNAKGTTLSVNYTYTIPAYKYDKETESIVVDKDKPGEDYTGTATVDGIDKVYTEIEKQVNEKMQGVVDQINGLNTELKKFTTSLNDLQDQINTMLDNASTSLNKQIKDIISDIKTNLKDATSGYISTVNSYISKVNSVLNRVTSYINNINSKLQPVMLYEASDGSYAQLSAAKAFPTQVTVAGGNAINLIPTSYTAEILAPAYKKYVVVTNVFKTDDLSVNAQANDSKCKAALDLANNTENFFNTVLEGTQKSVAFQTSADYKGYTYEIAYIAVDYSGYMAIRRHYISVR